MLPSFILSIFFGCSMMNPLSVWLMLELNMIMFLLMLFLDSPLTNTETPMKYFMVQAVSSSTMMWGVLTGVYSSVVSWLFITISMLLKLGAAPLHSWYINIVQKVSWSSLFLLSTIQKILPLFFWSLSISSPLIFIIITLSSFMSLMALSQCLFKRILGYSSVFNMSFMFATLEDVYIFSVFFFFYTATTLGIIMWGTLYNINVIHKNYNNSLKSGVALLLLLSSLGGIPPFLGFWAKLLVIGGVLDTSNYFLITLILVSSMIMLVTYLYVGLTLVTMKQFYNLWPLKHQLSNVVSLLVSAPILFMMT